MAQVRWTGVNRVLDNMTRYKLRVRYAVLQVALYFQGVFENYAKEYAPWTDRTANARQSLHAFVEELADDAVRLYLAHGMDYGVYLETKYQGRYAILWPTIQAHLGQIRQMLNQIFGR